VIFFHRRRRFRSSVIVSAFLALCTLLLSACGGDAPTATQKRTLVVATQLSNFALAGFNPFSTNPNRGVLGFVYEPLEVSNVNDGKYSPLLALDHTWNADVTELTFHLRQGVKWNDSQPFSSADVLFTYNALKQYPAADTTSVWSYIDSVAAPDANTFVVKLKQSYVPALYYIATQVPILPKHVFESVGDVTKYNNQNVVGTGPFKVDRFTDDLLVFTRYQEFWGSKDVQVDEIRMPYYNGNQAFMSAMPTGTIDWSGYYDENLKKTFIDKDPAHNFYYMDAINQVGIFMDLAHDTRLQDVAVRKALSAALDRQSFSQQATAGFTPPVAQHGLVLPAGKDYLDPAYANLPITPAATQAEQYLKDASYTKGSDGIYQKDGQRLSFELTSVIGYTDWNAIAQTAQLNLKAIGVEVNIKLISESEFRTNFRGASKPFQLLINSANGGPTPYYVYNSLLNSQSIPPKGRNNASWQDAETDALLQQFATSSDAAVQKQAMQGIEKIMVEKVPYIPILGGARWCEYTTTRFTGWPSEQNPYSSCTPYLFPDNEFVLLHLKAA
jgi:peptide/nickel transport system substrate-binding protein